MLAAYVDDSGTSGNQPVVFVAGFCADDNYWASWEVGWRKFLDHFGIDRFHAAPFLARTRPYSFWSNDKYEDAKASVCAFLKNSGIPSIGYGVSSSIYARWRDEIDFYRDSDPYFFCLETCLTILIRAHWNPNIDDGIAIYIDQDNGREKLGLRLARWQESRLRRDPDPFVSRQRQVSAHYVSNRLHLPLQIADIVAHGFYQRAESFLRTGEYSIGNAFIQALEGSDVPPLFNFIHSSEVLDSVANWKPRANARK